jgi:glycosyltransferase involved in cell wall biosynthesis
MRITVLTSSYPRFPGDGTAPFIRSLSEELAQLGHDVEVVAPYDPAVTTQFDQRIAVHRFRYALLDRWHIMGHAKSLASDMKFKPGVFFLLPSFLLLYFWCALRIARRQRAEIVHAHWVLPSGLVGAWVAAVLRIPLAVSVHGSDMFAARRNPVLRRMARGVFRRASVVTTCSEDLRGAAVEVGCDHRKVHVVPYGADPNRFHPEIPPLDRADFGVTQNEVLVVALGRMVRKKGFDVLVRALSLLPPSCAHVHAVIGGDGVERERIAFLALELGVSAKLHMTGGIPWDQVPGFLAMGDVFVLPSVRDAAGNVDGLPNVLLEAMACGLPCVATHIGGVPLVIQDGVNGILCPPDDSTRLSQAIALVVGDGSLRARLGREARASVDKRFNWRGVGRRVSALLQGALASRCTPRLGTQYRIASFRAYGLRFEGGRVLDVGCYDGALLETLEADLRVGVDLAPVPCRRSVFVIQADGTRLPFRDGAFDQVIAADIIEHVPDNVALIGEVVRVTRSGGNVFLTTPSADIRLS